MSDLCSYFENKKIILQTFTLFWRAFSLGEMEECVPFLFSTRTLNMWRKQW